MSLESLAKDITAAAQAEADELAASAQSEADTMRSEAEAKAESIRSEAAARAERDAEQIGREIVASARQANQRDLLIARRAALDATLEQAKSTLADPKWKGRAALLKSLMARADDIGGKGYSVRPMGIDRKAVSDLAGGKKVGDDADGLGGFILDAEDGSVSYDFRFDALLDRAWSSSLPAVTAALFD